MANAPIIKVRHLIAGYGEDIILDDVSFDVFHGEIFVILGGSGCGKSTLLKHMIGLIRPISGRVIIDGDDITNCSEEKFHAILQKMGVLYQSAALLGSMTIGENIELPIREYTDLSEEAITTLVQMKLNLVHLEGYRDHLPSEISGGMKKRAGLARAMAMDPDILFFDEPSAGLDPVSSRLLDELILELRESLKTTLVVVSHELASIFTIGNNSIYLDVDERTMTASGDPRKLRDHSPNPSVHKFLTRGEE